MPDNGACPSISCSDARKEEGEEEKEGEGGSVSLKKRRGDKKGRRGRGWKRWKACKSGIAARHAAWRVSALIRNEGSRGGRGRLR